MLTAGRHSAPSFETEVPTSTLLLRNIRCPGRFADFLRLVTSSSIHPGKLTVGFRVVGLALHAKGGLRQDLSEGGVLATLIGFLGDFDLAEEAAREVLRHRRRAGGPATASPGTRVPRALAARGRSADRRQLHGGIDEHDHVSRPAPKLIFTSCHPALAVEAQVALTLRPLGGLTTGEIPR